MLRALLFASFLALATVPSIIAGCEANCDGAGSGVPPVITVTDASDGRPICDATAVATCPDAPPRELSAVRVEDRCLYGVPIRVHGSVEAVETDDIGPGCILVVSKSGFLTARFAAFADVEPQSCGATLGQQVDVRLMPR
jgi:hypothetical protein